MRGIKIPEFALKMQGGAYARGGRIWGHNISLHEKMAEIRCLF